MRDFTTVKKLGEKFRQQEDFCQGYAPLYQRLFGAVAGWLQADNAGTDELVVWLADAGKHRKPLAVTLLLASGLHRAILAGELPALAAYYPSVGGRRPFDDPAFAPTLRDAILEKRPALAELMVDSTIQTNETGRGLSWLLPLALTGWETVHLVDLGASAGLNLLADQRHYRLMPAHSRAASFHLGAGAPPQFESQCQGAKAYDHIRANLRPLPRIASRLGGDVRPFPLKSAADELALLSFVWPEHPERRARLQEALAVRRRLNGAIRLEALNLPEGVEDFLAAFVPADDHPVLIYNTIMALYLSDRGASLRQRIGQWALGQNRPVLWAQWEYSSEPDTVAGSWAQWTVDLWQNGRHNSQALGWAHPHGGHLRFEEMAGEGDLFAGLR